MVFVVTAINFEVYLGPYFECTFILACMLNFFEAFVDMLGYLVMLCVHFTDMGFCKLFIYCNVQLCAKCLRWEVRIGYEILVACDNQ